MPTTLAALLVIVFAIVPGVPGETFFSIIVGANWREEQWRRIVRVISISLAGLVVYILFASLVGLPMPSYILPSQFSADAFTTSVLPTMAGAYVGHLTGAMVCGILSAYVVRKVARLSTYPDTWDDFVRKFVPDHWVIVELVNGSVYAGILKKADISVRQSERDIVLVEPALYSEETDIFTSLDYQYLFLPAALISSIAVYYDSALDTRITPVNQPLFSEDPDAATDKSTNGDSTK